jgi:aspartyl-tRNA(Asn)/glutamyl-tRNA(Gln) amidotransferase subunit B
LSSVVFEGKALAQTLATESASMVSNQNDLERIIDDVLVANPDIVQKYLSGKTNAMGFLVGEIMKKTRGSANPKTVNEILSKKLQNQNS